MGLEQLQLVPKRGLAQKPFPSGQTLKKTWKGEKNGRVG